MIKKDEILLKKVFPSGYENIELPVNMPAFRCPCVLLEHHIFFVHAKTIKAERLCLFANVLNATLIMLFLEKTIKQILFS